MMSAAVLAWLMTYAIQSTLLLGAIALVTRFLVRSDAWRDVLWKVGLVGGVVSSIVLSMTVVQPLAGRYVLGAVEAARAPERVIPPSVSPPAIVAPSEHVDLEPMDVARVKTNVSAARASEKHAADITFESVATPIVAVWLAGALVLLMRLLVRRRALFTMLAGRRAVTAGAAATLFQEIVHDAPLRGRVRLTSSAACPLPMALKETEVCVPERFLIELDADQQRGALAHETAHLVRRDPAWLLAAMVLEAVFFFQPLNVLARRRMKEAAEYLCDEWALRAGSGLGLARCLATVASWIQVGQEQMLARTSAIGERRSALVQRVERLVMDRAMSRARPFAASYIAVALVVFVGFAAPAVATVGAENDAGPVTLAYATQENVIRAPDAAAPLRERWSWALREAGARRRGGFWIVYAFDRPIPPDHQYISDSEGLNFDEIDWRGTPLRSVLGGGAAYDRGTIAVMFHFESASGERAIDRMGHRNMTIGMPFGRDPVFWLGTASDAESVPVLEDVLGRVQTVSLQEEAVDAIALHATSTIVLPVLGRVLSDHPEERVRAEAAEGFEHHDVPEALNMAERAAQRDASPQVRREAAEAIGGIDVERAPAVLVGLATSSDDTGVRQEAAEALGDQPQSRALPALERLIFEASDQQVQAEAAEALSEFGDASLELLRRVIWEHPVRNTQREAVETLGDLGSERTLSLLAEILERHPDAAVQAEALDVLAEIDSPRSRTMLLDAATRGAAPETRREAVELIGRAEKEDARTPEQVADLAALLERLVFEDPDRGVSMEALDAIAELPRATATRVLRKVIETHKDARLRREAVDLLGELR
jgi:beta-lactamase regulating signal transducer with metallopeptidase domain/HEAT repeat protein